VGDAAAAVGVVIVAYLLGTFPTAALVGRHGGFDPEQSGSRNPGASNAFRVGGRRAGILVLVGDLGKGMAATALGLVVGGRPLAAAAGLAAVLGHVAPATRRFRGGKGVATAAGMAVVLYPLLAVALAVVWVAVACLTKKAAVASLAAAAVAVPALVIMGRPAWELAVVAFVVAVVAVRHRSNVARLRAGRETDLRNPA
jgi:glycerol-3-phosphate acyltransferase PlsY